MGTIKKKLSYLEYVNRENAFVHPSYSEDILQYIYLRDGDKRAVEEAVRNFDPAIQGRISVNDLRNIKYLFVAATTLACRYAIDGGMDQKKAFSASDFFIRQMDAMEEVDQVVGLHKEMISYYLNGIIAQRKKQLTTLPVVRCINYIYDHLNEKITAADLAAHVDLHPNYLSTLFRKETGMTITEYIQAEKIETACNMLRYTNYSLSDISNSLDFSSQSYFIQVFRKRKGMTPGAYRDRYLPGSFSEPREGQV